MRVGTQQIVETAQDEPGKEDKGRRIDVYSEMTGRVTYLDDATDYIERNLLNQATALL